jgi:uncharacterized membrane protein
VTGGSLGPGGSPPGGTGGRPGTGGSLAGGTGGARPDAGGDATAQVSYAAQIAPLLAANCTSCHGASNPSAGISLNNHTNVKANASRANSMIQSGRMPPTGALSAANKALFQAWIDQGAPNN